MNNPLIDEARRLANKNGFEPSGQMVIRKESTKGKWAGQTVIVFLNFYGAEELVQAVNWAITNGYEPGYPAGIIDGSTIRPLDLVGTTPKCPVHGTPMKESKKPGTYYCPRRVGGGFCDQKA